MSRSSTWLLSTSHKKAKKEPLNYVDTPHEWWVSPTRNWQVKKVWESTQLTMLKRRTSGGATTRDKTRS